MSDEPAPTTAERMPPGMCGCDELPHPAKFCGTFVEQIMASYKADIHRLQAARDGARQQAIDENKEMNRLRGEVLRTFRERDEAMEWLRQQHHQFQVFGEAYAGRERQHSERIAAKDYSTAGCLICAFLRRMEERHE